MEFVESNKGFRKLHHEGYIYVKQKSNLSNVVTYECSQRRRSSLCKAKLKLKNDEIIGTVNSHSHAPDASAIEISKTLKRMKNLSKTTLETPHQIISKCTAGISETVAANLPTIHHLKRNLRQCRQRTQNTIPLPLSTEELVIPKEYTTTKANEDFLLFDSGCIGPRTLVFGTKKNLSYLKDSQHWFMDGTFSVTPSLFAQLYTIHAYVNGRTIPCLYCLLPNKKQATYTLLLAEINKMIYGLNPTSIMIDFEKAMINSINSIFPHAAVKGCFFHLSQNLYRKIQELGLSEKYRQEETFSLQMRMISALAFCPPDEVADRFDLLVENLSDDATPVLDYFEDTYIGRLRVSGRKPPLFEISLWNMFTRTDDELPKTNNAIEGWHRSLKSLFQCCHPNIWMFLNIIQDIQQYHETKAIQELSGHQQESKKKRYKDLAARIKNITTNCKSYNRQDYLKCVALNLSF